ncbi:MAG: NfeD family protein [Clostridia bacterium]|nr:NfeD family protein [Clostridia bacterium]
MDTWTIWVIAAVIFAIIEIYTPSFFIIWFSVGSIGAAITSIFTDNTLIQIGVFIVLSLVLVLSTKRLTDKFITKKNSYKTNSDKLIGKVGLVIEDINPIESLGRVKIQGESWKATSTDNKEIEKGSKVKVDKIDGVTLYVTKE